MNTSEIRATYDRLWSEAVQSIQTNSIRTDPQLLNKTADVRRGLTLICRPSRTTRDAVMQFLQEARSIEPDQYYYRSTELHTTVMSILTCREDFERSKVDTASLVEVLKQAVDRISSYSIDYRGITASPDSVIVQGFPQDSTLQKLRQSVREHVKRANIPSTLDDRYRIHTAHMTCVRFREPLYRSAEFLRFLHHFRDVDYGTSKVTELEFVVNDWYMSDEHTEIVHRFPLIGT